MTVTYEEMVKKLTGGWPAELLATAFDLVSNKKDWKAPISYDHVKTELKELVAAAVEFYTATEATFEPSGVEGYWKVKAAGYRAGPAGDH